LKIRKVRYAPHIPGITERHCAAFFTLTGHVIIIKSTFDKQQGLWPIFNTSTAEKIAKDIIKGKESSISIIPFPGVIAWETTSYDKNLAGLARSGQLVEVLVIENIPESEDELQQFAFKAFSSPK
jgi:hypothetical protein